MQNFLEIGKIVSTHGIKGELKVQPWCDSPEFIINTKTFYLNKGNEEIKLTSKKIHKNMVIIKVDGIDTPEDAVKLRNKILYIDRNSVKLEAGTYFISDLIGLKVIDADTEKLYGIIDDVSKTGANDVYHIKSSDDKLYYIPAIKQVIVKTDIENGKLFIRPLKGLFDDED